MRTLIIFLCVIFAAVGCGSSSPVPDSGASTSDSAADATPAASGGDADSDETATDDDVAPTSAPEPSSSDTDTETDDPESSDTAATDEEPGAATERDRVALLLAHCEAGSNMACDVLIMNTDEGSPEEDTALHCGGRSEDRVLFCTEGFEHKGRNYWFEDDSPGIAGVVTLCEDGDMTACDFLFERAPVGSEYEAIGDGCAYRIDVAVPDCRTVFADEFGRCPSDLPTTCE